MNWRKFYNRLRHRPPRSNIKPGMAAFIEAGVEMLVSVGDEPTRMYPGDRMDVYCTSPLSIYVDASPGIVDGLSADPGASE